MSILAEIASLIGSDIDLSELKTRRDKNVDQDSFRRTRVGIEIDCWIYQTCQENQHLLSSKLTGRGRSNNKDDEAAVTLRFITKCAKQVVNSVKVFAHVTSSDLLVVFGGITQTNYTYSRRDSDDSSTGEISYKQRLNAYRQDDTTCYSDVSVHVLEMLRYEEISFMVAPFSADAQLAFLQQQGYIDLIITDNPGILMYDYASSIIYKAEIEEGKSEEGKSEENKSSKMHRKRPKITGKIIRLQIDLPGYNDCNFSRFSPSMVSMLFTAAGGSDQCPCLDGIDFRTAYNALNDVFLPQNNELDDNNDDDESFGGGKVNHSRSKVDSSISGSDSIPSGPYNMELFYEEIFKKCTKSLFKSEKMQYVNDFIKTSIAHRHAVVFDPVNNICCHMNDHVLVHDSNAGREQLSLDDSILLSQQPYKDIVNDREKLACITGHIKPTPLCTFIAEGRLHYQTGKPYEAVGIEIKKQSRLVREYLGEICSDESEEGDSLDNDNGSPNISNQRIITKLESAPTNESGNLKNKKRSWRKVMEQVNFVFATSDQNDDETSARENESHEEQSISRSGNPADNTTVTLPIFGDTKTKESQEELSTIRSSNSADCTTLQSSIFSNTRPSKRRVFNPPKKSTHHNRSNR